jgi:hypothetical protein
MWYTENDGARCDQGASPTRLNLYFLQLYSLPQVCRLAKGSFSIEQCSTRVLLSLYLEIS